MIEETPLYELQYISGKVYYKTSPQTTTVQVLDTLTDERSTLDLPAGTNSFVLLQSGTQTAFHAFISGFMSNLNFYPV